jgi:hypothetical protein
LEDAFNLALIIAFSNLPLLTGEGTSSTYLKIIKKNGAGVNTNPVFGADGLEHNNLKYLIIFPIAPWSYWYSATDIL